MPLSAKRKLSNELKELVKEIDLIRSQVLNPPADLDAEALGRLHQRLDELITRHTRLQQRLKGEGQQ